MKWIFEFPRFPRASNVHATMFRRLLNVLYAIEFLIALIAVYTVWREVGGAGHIDYMPWYWKAGLGVPAAVAIVRLTLAAVDEDAGRTRRMVIWSVVLAVLAISAGGITYYTHLNEPQDESDEDPGTITPAAFQLRSLPSLPSC
jgi:cytochrome bd-type quinol oxidase subunit 2